jgi:hypothetical protein
MGIKIINLTKMNLYKQMIPALILFAFLNACSSPGNGATPSVTTNKAEIKTPGFNTDSAYQFVAAQIANGPRVPNSEAHKKTAQYLSAKLKSFGANVIVQEADLIAFDGKTLHAKNIIGQFSPEKNDRILLFAHWDSRPFSDHDANTNLYNQPVDGANDGASGVGILLEIARQLNLSPVKPGIDIIFFDAEDYGTPDNQEVSYKPDTWCLGSQYWAKNPHKPNYYARYGILLDMVGAKGAMFYKEYFSTQMAPEVVHNIWQTASKLGYGNYFIFDDGGAITDDHIYVNKHLGIQCVDIIQHDPSTDSGFGFYWHTHNDTMENVDKNTLKAVGQTLLNVLYND